MRIPPPYQITPGILNLLAKIEGNRIFLNSTEIPQDLKENIQRISLLKSSLFSARIEGNPLTIEELGYTKDKVKKMEVFNILKAIKYIERNIKPKDVCIKKMILDIHKIILKDLSSSAGYFRIEPGAIFNQANVAIYVSPPPSQISSLVETLLDFINKKEEKFPLVVAFLAHLIFEKIHPFIDGNGRVGRLLVFSILKLKDWNFPVFIPLEEYLDDHKEDYYYFLDIGLGKPNEYLSFMLEAFWQESEKIKKEIIQKQHSKISILPPRQEEIYQIIKDQKVISFDRVRRRFLKIPERTLRYDLKKLQEKRLINKIGQTRGSLYTTYQ